MKKYTATLHNDVNIQVEFETVTPFDTKTVLAERSVPMTIKAGTRMFRTQKDARAWKEAMEKDGGEVTLNF